MRQHFTTLKGQPTAGVAIFVKKCVFLEIQDFIVFAYMLMTVCVCVWQSIHLILYMFSSVFVIIGVCVGKLFYDFDGYVCICMGKPFFDFVHVFHCFALFVDCVWVRSLIVFVGVCVCPWARISMMLYVFLVCFALFVE